MAALAAPSELAKVGIIVGVAGNAVAGELQLCGWPRVAAAALQAAMCAREGEAAFLCMIELPLVPGVGMMTTCAVVAE